MSIKATIGLAFDFVLFGHGKGLSVPHFFNRIYWIPATSEQPGNFYFRSGFAGCQMASHQWRRPPAGTRCRIKDHNFVVYQTTRRLFRVEVTWRLVRLPIEVDKANSMIRAFYWDLNND